MLAPIITKDMKLFPMQKNPKQIKNVRSRAQTLDHFQQLQNSLSTIDRLVPVRPRSSQSTGNISTRNSGSNRKIGPRPSSSLASVNRSPPKPIPSKKSTLSAIQEGVEMGGGIVPHSKSESSSVQSETTRRHRPGLRKNSIESELSSEDDGSPRHERHNNNNEDNNEDTKKRKSVFKWLTKTFRKSAREKFSDDASTNST